MTAIFDASDLPQGLYQSSRTTKTGFKLKDSRLNAFVPTPEGKRPKDSGIWEHGEALSKLGNSKDNCWFLCRRCFQAKPSLIKTYDSTDATTSAVRHLRKKHNLLVITAPKRAAGQMDSYISRVEKHRDASLQRDIFNKAFVDWAVCDDLPLRQASSERLYHLLNTCSPVAAELQKASKTSVRDMIG